jgi:uncharacterized membrane-anchored protein
MKDYPINDDDINNFISMNDKYVNSPGIDNLQEYANDAKKKWKETTNTPLKLIISIITLIIMGFFVVLALSGLFSMSVFDYVKFIVILILVVVVGFVLYTM